MNEKKQENPTQMHESFFSGDFKVVPFEYSALMDVRPWN
jgi:hypothetical protein